ncbi:MAG TPA: ABC transporter substrate-binding protein [Albitalea sp.]
MSAMRARDGILLLAITAGACGRAAAPGQPVPRAGECVAAGGTSDVQRDTLVVALARPFQLERLTRPADEAERTLVRNLYETLVRLDCTGAPAAGLAARWHGDDTGTRWTFVLRPGARFADGQPLTARAVPAGWAERGGPRRVETRGPRSLIRTVEGSDDSTFTVELERPAPVSIFADPSLAVVRRDGGAWPVGTGPYRVVDPGPSGRSGYANIRLARAATEAEPGPGGQGARAAAAAPRGPAVLEFTVPPGGDLRTALDLGADIVLTRDAGALAYAGAIEGVATAPLPWDRTYVLLAPTATGVAEPPPTRALQDLAGSAIRTEARPAAPLATDPATCPASAAARIGGAGPLLGSDTAPRILYLARDEAARGLAERLAALAGPPASAPWAALRLPIGRPAIAVPVDSTALDRALREGRDAGYIVRAAAGEPCVRAGLIARAPWLERAAGAAVTPLVDTRARAILRAGTGAVFIEGDGALRFDPALPAPSVR